MHDKTNKLYNIDNIEFLRTLPDNSISNICTDVPYALCDIDALKMIKEDMQNKSDFMGRKWFLPSIEFLKECDVVITNPPFSIITQWYNLVKKYDKKFIVIAPPTFVSRKGVRQDFFNKKIFINAASSRECDRGFATPDGSKKEIKCYPYSNIKKIDYNYRDTTHKVFMKDCNYEYYDGTNILAIVDGERIPIDYNGLFTLSISQCWHFDFKKYDLICFTTDYKEKLLINGKEQFVRLLCKKNSKFEPDAKVETKKEQTQNDLF